MKRNIVITTILTFVSLSLSSCGGVTQILPPSEPDEPDDPFADGNSYKFENDSTIKDKLATFEKDSEGYIGKENTLKLLEVLGTNDFVINSSTFVSENGNKIGATSSYHPLNEYKETSSKSIKRYQNEDNSILLLDGTSATSLDFYVDNTPEDDTDSYTASHADDNFYYQVNRVADKSLFYEFFDYATDTEDYAYSHVYSIASYKSVLNLVHGANIAATITDLYNKVKDNLGVTSSLNTKVSASSDAPSVISFSVLEIPTNPVALKVQYEIEVELLDGHISSYSYDYAKLDSANNKLLYESFAYTFSVENNLSTFSESNILKIADFTNVIKK